MTQLKSIRLYRFSGFNHKDMEPFSGTAEFVNELGEIHLKLPPEAAERLVAVIAEELIAAARLVADEMTMKIIEGIKPTQIEVDK